MKKKAKISRSVKSTSIFSQVLGKFLDKFMYVVGFCAFLVYIPQVWKVWGERSVVGLSLTTWVGFTVGSSIWLVYGIYHKDKPIIFSNVLFFLVNLSIVMGIISFS